MNIHFASSISMGGTNKNYELTIVTLWLYMHHCTNFYVSASWVHVPLPTSSPYSTEVTLAFPRVQFCLTLSRPQSSSSSTTRPLWMLMNDAGLVWRVSLLRVQWAPTSSICFFEAGGRYCEIYPIKYLRRYTTVKNQFLFNILWILEENSQSAQLRDGIKAAVTIKSLFIHLHSGFKYWNLTTKYEWSSIELWSELKWGIVNFSGLNFIKFATSKWA